MSEARNLEVVTQDSRLLIPDLEPERWPHAVLAFALVTTAGVAGMTIWLQGSLQDASRAADVGVLASASSTFAEMLQSATENTQAHVRVMADDARIRTTLATPGIDPATIEDVLVDLTKASGLSWLAVLDAQRKVVAVVGNDELRGNDLSTSSVFKGATGATIWRSQDSLMAVAAAPVNLGFENYYLLGTTAVDQRKLDVLGKSTGLSAALVLDGKRAVESLRQPQDGDAIDQVIAQGVQGIGAGLAARVDVLSEAPRIIKLVLLVSNGAGRQALTSLSALMWAPLAFVLFMGIVGVGLAYRQREV